MKKEKIFHILSFVPMIYMTLFILIMQSMANNFGSFGNKLYELYFSPVTILIVVVISIVVVIANWYDKTTIGNLTRYTSMLFLLISVLMFLAFRLS